MKEHDLNEKLRKFLISRRESAGKGGYSQSEVAHRSGVYGIRMTLDQRAVSRIEQQPLHADAVKLLGYLSAVGISPDEYFDLLSKLTNQTQENTKMERSEQAQQKLDDTNALISQAQAMLKRDNHKYLKDMDLDQYFEGAKKELNLLNRKPIIGFFGPFDAGKSTLINTYLGQSVLPTGYQPATYVVNILMHEQLRPDFISGTVAVFRKGFMPYMIQDKKMVSDHLIEEGDISILDRIGVHNHDDQKNNDAHTAILFLDADILKHVWLLDTPGELNDDDSEASDTNKALSGSEFADGVVFLSFHTGFFKDSDLAFGSNIIRQHPPLAKETPLAHLLFIQSHCHPGISNEDVEKVGVVTFKRIHPQLESIIFKTWKSDGNIEKIPAPQDLTDRVQPFWREDQQKKSKTIERLNHLASYLNDHQDKIIEKGCDKAIETLTKSISGAINLLHAKKTDAMKRVRDIEEQDARFRDEAEITIKKFNDLIESITHHKKNDLDDISAYYNNSFSKEGLMQLIKNTYKGDKKQAKSEISSYISQLISSRIENQLKRSGKLVSNEVESLLTQWQSIVPNYRVDINNKEASSFEIQAGSSIKLDSTDFNSRAAFIGGLSGLASLGAMSLYVSTIASNLGAYILVGKAAGVLVSLGLVGSVTSVTSFVAMIGGPITIGIGLAFLIGSIVYFFTNGSWEESMAKKIAEGMKKNDVWSDIEKPIIKFWDDTSIAISAGLKELRKKTEQHIDLLKKDAQKTYDIAQLNDCIEKLNSINQNLSSRS